jgi:hypothetical protein
MPKNELRTTTVTIGAGASLSGSTIDLATLGNPVAIITDAAWDTNAVTFQASVDGTNFFNLYKEATEYSLAGVTASTLHSLDMQAFAGLSHLKIRSGTAAAAVNQVDATVITLVCWHIDE